MVDFGTREIKRHIDHIVKSDSYLPDNENNQEDSINIPVKEESVREQPRNLHYGHLRHSNTTSKGIPMSKQGSYRTVRYWVNKGGDCVAYLCMTYGIIRNHVAVGNGSAKRKTFINSILLSFTEYNQYKF